MKVIMLQILFMSVFVSCSEEKEQKLEVEIFIQQVRDNKYTADSLPDFSPDAIPILLKFANDFSEISNFPINPISAFAPNRLTLGECLLWTIEHVRLHYGNYSGNPSFPSFVPELGIKGDINSPFLTNNQLNDVYNLYKDWWYDNVSKDFEIIRKINPLVLSNYVWK